MERPKRESKAAFWTRVGREGRDGAAKDAEANLLARGRSRRDAQAALVQRFQPLDGTRTVAHQTPDSWAHGRVDAKKQLSPQERHDLDCQWAHDHPDCHPEQAPTTGARLMLRMLQEKPVPFAKDWTKCVARIEQRELSRREHRRKLVRARRDAKLKREAEERERVEARKRSAERKRKEAERLERLEREARERAEWEERERVRRAEEAEGCRQEDEWLAEQTRQATREQAELRELAFAVQLLPAAAGESEVL